MKNEKKLKKGFYFGYGENNFGIDCSLPIEIIADLSLNEGCGIALKSNEHIDFKNISSPIKFKLKNNSDSKVLIKIEKKFNNDVKTGFELIESNSISNILVTIDNNEKEMKELVIAILREDNESKKYSLSVEVTY